MRQVAMFVAGFAVVAMAGVAVAQPAQEPTPCRPSAPASVPNRVPGDGGWHPGGGVGQPHVPAAAQSRLGAVSADGVARAAASTPGWV